MSSSSRRTSIWRSYVIMQMVAMSHWCSSVVLRRRHLCYLRIYACLKKECFFLKGDAPQTQTMPRASTLSRVFPFIAMTPYGVFILASLNATFTVTIFMLSLTTLKETTPVFGIIQHCNCKHYAKLSRRGGRGGIQVPTRKGTSSDILKL